MSGFKTCCANCGSDKVLEQSSKKNMGCFGTKTQFSRGLERKCLNCKNESYVLFSTWFE